MRFGTSGSETSSSGKAMGSSWPWLTPQNSTKTTRDAERIVMDDLDALFLRNDSIDDLQERPRQVHWV
jgi:hypothetical protein